MNTKKLVNPCRIMILNSVYLSKVKCLVSSQQNKKIKSLQSEQLSKIISINVILCLSSFKSHYEDNSFKRLKYAFGPYKIGKFGY